MASEFCTCSGPGSFSGRVDVRGDVKLVIHCDTCGKPPAGVSDMIERSDAVIAAMLRDRKAATARTAKAKAKKPTRA